MTTSAVVPYQNQMVVERIAKEEGVPLETAELWFGEMVKFLLLAGRTRKKISPSREIDAAWHAFILHTRDYAAFCDQYVGRFVHHQPTPGVANVEAYLHTRALAEEHFGELDSSIWPEKPRTGDCDTGSDPDGECLDLDRQPKRKLQLASGDCSSDTDCHDDGHCTL